MKKLTIEKLEELETKIVEWAKRWNISLKYWHIDLPGKCYVPENDESYEWDNEELKKIYGESFIFGMAIDGKIYEVLHYAELSQFPKCLLQIEDIYRWNGCQLT